MRVFTGALLALALILPISASAQSPALCNANLLDETLSRSTDTAGPGDIVTYLVGVTNRSMLDSQVGCDVLDVTADFCCPGPTGEPAEPPVTTPPGPLCTRLANMVPTIPANDAVAFFGICSSAPTSSSLCVGSCQVCQFPNGACPMGEVCSGFPCRMPDLGTLTTTCDSGGGVLVPCAEAGVFGVGFLDDGFRSPFEIDKTIAVAIVPTTTTTTSTTTTTTTTTSTTTSTTSTTLPPLCLSRTPGFWGNHPFLITGSDPRSLDLLPLDVCGTTLDNTDAGSDTSTTEAICSVGTDSKILGPQLTQLVRQCTAALLNVATSTELGGECAAAFPDVDFVGCCGPDSACTGGGTLTISECLDQIGGFNEAESSTLSFPFTTGPAKSGTCRASKGNGIVVSPTP